MIGAISSCYSDTLERPAGEGGGRRMLGRGH